MQPSKEMMDGWQMMSVIMGDNAAGQYGASYIAGIESEISAYSDAINNTYRAPNHSTIHNDDLVPSIKGLVAEDFQAGTFNVNAAARSSYLRSIKLGVNSKNSVDVVTVDVRTLTKDEWLHPADHYDSILLKAVDNGKYQMKVYSDPIKGFNALAEIDSETGRAKYGDQQALTTSDTKDYLQSNPRGISHVLRKTHDQRQNVADASKHAAATLNDHIEHDGIDSLPASNERYEKIAKTVLGEEEYNPSDDGVTIDNVVQTNLLVSEALKGGATAAAITFVMQMAPEVVKIIRYLARNGEIDIHQISRFGEQAITSTARSFLRGSIASGMVIASKKGLLGSGMQSVNSSVIGALVAVVMETSLNSIKLASGSITPREMGLTFIDNTVNAVSWISAAKLGGNIAQVIAPHLPGLGFLIGSLIGCSISILYNVGKNQFISFCKDTGFTCFGLVDQNYAVPEELLREMGVETIQIPRAKIDRAPIDLIRSASPIHKIEHENVEYRMVKRGVIGLNKVGYVL